GDAHLPRGVLPDQGGARVVLRERRGQRDLVGGDAALERLPDIVRRQPRVAYPGGVGLAAGERLDGRGRVASAIEAGEPAAHLRVRLLEDGDPEPGAAGRGRV